MIFYPVHSVWSPATLGYFIGAVCVGAVWWMLARRKETDPERVRFRPVKLLLAGFATLMLLVMGGLSAFYVMRLKPLHLEGNAVTYGSLRMRVMEPGDVYVRMQDANSPYATSQVADSTRILVLDNKSDPYILLSEHDYEIDSIVAALRLLSF